MPLSICVFCGSGKMYESKFQSIAKKLALICKASQYKIVYGGASVGLMGLVADAALDAEVEVTGVIPEFLLELEIAHSRLSSLEKTDSMHIRKQRMLELSDVFLVLPGGFGTLDEMFEMLTWSQLKLHSKPVLLWNEEGFFDYILQHIRFLHQNNFISEEDFKRLIVVNNVEQVDNFLRQFEAQK